MTHPYQLLTLLLYTILLCSCAPQQRAESQTPATSSPTGSASEIRSMKHHSCEDCDLMFIGMPLHPASVDTSLGWDREGQRLIVKGNVYHQDGTTPADNVILYYYHTDKKGHYAKGPDLPYTARRHGYLRGWIQTGPDGAYAIYTSRPAQYPDGRTEAHIHVIVKEPDIDVPYWIDAFIFDDDPIVTEAYKRRLENRGGSGVLTVRTEEDIQIAHHDVILGLHVPHYPARK